MFKFILKRLLIAIPILFFLSFITLLLINIVPGNYFDALRMNPQMAQDVVAQYEERFHINEPVIVQYFYWLKGICTLDFGYSFTYQQPVITLIGSRLFNTFLLSFCSLLLAWFISIPCGVIAAYRKGTLIDGVLSFTAYIFLSIPGFFLAMLLMFLAGNFTALPLGGMRSLDFETFGFFQKIGDVFLHMLIPLIILSSGTAAYLFRLMRSNMLEVVHNDFVRVLHTRPLSKKYILFKHVLRNAINPLITILGFQLPALFSGAALVEIITGWPGLGSIMLQAVRSQDIFLVMGNMVMISFLLIVGNMCADVLLVLVDPRVRYE